MIKAIIFDCFGVLVGSGFWNVYQSLGGDPTKDADFIAQNLKKNDLGELSWAQMCDIMSKHLGVSPEEYVAAHNTDELPNPQIFEFIHNELKPKYKIGLLSNAGPGVVEDRIPPELRRLFDAVVVSGEVGMLKPDPRIFRLALERLEVLPEQAVFTDDHSPYLVGAEELGMRTILYKNFVDFKQQLNSLIGGKG